jgi:hypothetical protein
MRRAVRLRADNDCEYCRINEADTEYGCEVDHVISEKHGGKTELNNLALACFYCNRNKGSDVGSILSADNAGFVRFFNPRLDVWSDHFEFNVECRIVPKTDIASVTARILGFNSENRLLERRALRTG